MKKTMIGLKILEMTQTGLQEIIEMETERLEDPDAQKEAIDQVTQMLFKHDSMFLQVEDKSFVIRGLPNKTIVVRGVFHLESGQFSEDTGLDG